MSKKAKAGRKPKPKKPNYFALSDKNDADIRRDNLEKSTRQDDGVLLCPPKFCTGYGYHNKGI